MDSAESSQRPNPLDTLRAGFQDLQQHCGRAVDDLQSRLYSFTPRSRRTRRSRVFQQFGSHEKDRPPPASVSFPSRSYTPPPDVSAGKSAGRPQEDKPRADPVLVSEVLVKGVDGELKRVAEEALSMKPNFAYTVDEVEANQQAIFSTGWFEGVKPVAEDTRDGVRLTYEVKPNAEVRGVLTSGANVLPAAVLTSAFDGIQGKRLNLNDLNAALTTINNWYADQGIFGQVVDVNVSGGVVESKVWEATVGSLDLSFVDAAGQVLPGGGRTQPDVILRHLTTQPGGVYNMRQAKADVAAVYATGLFDDVNISPTMAGGGTEDPQPQVDLSLSVVERRSRGVATGAGFSSSEHSEGALPAFIGNLQLSERNFLGRGQHLQAALELGAVDKLFRLAHTDPWLGSRPSRTSRTIMLQNTRTGAAATHGRPVDLLGREETPGGGGDGNIIVGRVMGGVEFGRPLSTGWTGTMGLNWQHSRCVNETGSPLAQDCYGGPLSFSDLTDGDSMALSMLRGTYHGPRGTTLVASAEQALPLRPRWLNFNRLRAAAETVFPLGPCKLVTSGKAGAILGDLPPYEAFPIGGTNSVRGYTEGGVGTGRHFAVSSGEFRFPLVGPLEGCCFADYGTDFDSGGRVRGDPAGTRGKLGTGAGAGAGVRIDSPVGPLRFEYAFNQRGVGRFHLGVGSQTGL